jgi:hypothetical protein
MHIAVAHDLTIWRYIVCAPGRWAKSDVAGIVSADEMQYHLIMVWGRPLGSLA